MMQKLIKWEVAFVPLYALGVYVRGKYISVSHVLAAIICLAFAWLLIRRPVLKKSEVAWSLPFLAFLITGFVGLLLSPFGRSVWPKGGIQLVGMSIMVIMAVAVIRWLQRPGFLMGLTRILIISLGLFAAVGVVQFILLNFTPFGKLANFSFLNSIARGEVWRNAGVIGGIYRANSLSHEPAHFVRYLTLGLGLALIRLGAIGRTHRLNISSVVPLWAAVAIVCGYLVALSVIGWLLLAGTGLVLFVLSGKLKIKTLLSATAVGALLVGSLLVLIQQSEGALADKFGTLALITTTDVSSSGFQPEQLSALAVAANITVAEQNFMSDPVLGGGLGSHPVAYDQYAPSYVTLRPALDHLNADDAASLLVRLISEVGVLGLVLFVAGCLMIVVSAQKAILARTIRSPYSSMESLSLGYLVSFVGLLGVYLARTGHYYDPVFWISVALAAAIPAILKDNPTAPSAESTLVGNHDVT